MARRDGCSKEPLQPGFLAACPMCLRWRPRRCSLVSSGFNDCAWHRRFIPWITLLASIWTIAKMLLGSARHWRASIPVALVVWELWGVSSEANGQVCQECWDHDRPRWSHSSLDGTPKKSIKRVLKINAFYQKSGWAIVWLQDLRDFCAEFYWIRVRTRQGNPQGWEPCPWVYNCRTVQRYTFQSSWSWALCVALVLTWWASTPSALGLTIELPHAWPRLDKASRKSKRLEGITALLSSLSADWEKEFLAPSWLVAPRTLSILFVAWTVMLLVLGSLFSSYAFSAMDYARLRDFTLKSMIIRAVLDARVNPTLSLITTTAFVCTKNVHSFGDRLLCFREETIFSTTWSPGCSCEASSMASR